MLTNGEPNLTARHWAVLGVVRLTRGPILPERIARELHFESAEVKRLLLDLMTRGYIGQSVPN